MWVVICIRDESVVALLRCNKSLNEQSRTTLKNDVYLHIKFYWQQNILLLPAYLVLNCEKFMCSTNSLNGCLLEIAWNV